MSSFQKNPAQKNPAPKDSGMSFKRTSRTLFTLSAAAILAAAFGAQAAPAAKAPARSTGLQVTTQSAPVQTKVLNLPKGRSAVIDLPVDASDVFVSNPAVADAVLRTPRRIFVLGVDAGQSDAIFFDGVGRQILNLSIRVDAATDQLSDTVTRLFPRSKVEVQSLNGRIVLSGMATSAGEADQILRLAQGFVKEPTDVVNLMSVAGKDQVTLKVRIVEVERSMIKQLGLSTDITYNNGTRSYSFGRGNSFGSNGAFLGSKGACYSQTGAQKTANTITNNATTGTTGGTDLSNNVTHTTSTGTPTNTALPSDVLTTTDSTTNSSGTSLSTSLVNAATTTFASALGTDNTTCLQAFERAGLARTLAEPNLTAISGESAKFLAGGEFPVPVAQDNQGRITVEFKPFGVGLGFTPVVLSNGRISMKLSTEVSELTNTGSFALNANFTIPALNVRRAETTVEMQSGSSLMIAGLLQTKYKHTIDSLPGLTSLPILGALFRSRDFLNDETEMVVMVTPYIVSPTDPDRMQTPADNLQAPNDMNSVFMGQLNKVVKAKTGDAAPVASAAPYQAPIGYVIE